MKKNAEQQTFSSTTALKRRHERLAAEEELIEEMFESYQNGTFEIKEPVTRKGEDNAVSARVEINRDLNARYSLPQLMLGLEFFKTHCLKSLKPV